MERTIPTAAPAAVASPVCAILERSVAALRGELHALPLARSLESGTISRTTYAGLLQSLLTLHRSLEQALADARHLKGFDDPAFRREEALARDLRLLGGRLPLRASEPLDRFESQARAWARPPSVALAGALYAIEIERKHLLRLARPLAAALRVRIAPRGGLDYVLDGSRFASRRLRILGDWIDANARGADRIREVSEGAREILQTLGLVYRDAAGPR